MKFYIATSLDNAAVQQRLRILLERMGHECTVDWASLPDLRDGGTEEQRTERAIIDAQGVADADCILVVMHGGFGTHVELGVALGMWLAADMADKLAGLTGEAADLVREAINPPKIFFCNQKSYKANYPNVFHNHPLVEWVDGDAADIVTRVQAWAQDGRERWPTPESR